MFTKKIEVFDDELIKPGYIIEVITHLMGFQSGTEKKKGFVTVVGGDTLRYINVDSGGTINTHTITLKDLEGNDHRRVEIKILYKKGE